MSFLSSHENFLRILKLLLQMWSTCTTVVYAIRGEAQLLQTASKSDGQLQEYFQNAGWPSSTLHVLRDDQSLELHG